MSGWKGKVGATLGVIAVISVLSSTKEQREAARQRMKRYNWLFGLIAVALWSLLLFG